MRKIEIKERKEPLQFVEVLERKPLVLKLNDKYTIKVELMTGHDLMWFVTNYKAALKVIENIYSKRLPKSQSASLFQRQQVYLIDLIYQVSHQQYGIVKKFFYRMALFKELLSDYDKFVRVLELIILRMTEVKKKLQNLQNIDIWHNNTMPTVGGVPLSELIRTDENGNTYGIRRRFYKSNTN